MDLADLGRVVLDTSVCIYYLDRPADDPRRRVVEPVVSAAEAGTVELVISPVTVTELLVGPLRERNRAAEAAVRLFVTTLCRLAPAGLAVAGVAARLRAAFGLATPDALICATGVVEEADAVVGNDARWKRLDEVPYVHLDDVLGAAPPRPERQPPPGSP
ncbi:MAG TPA: PIN domain-containing protein [Egibacteraceae bacterium]|nr:PIN domain-containing protein [Egibacteraceae bacterium]